MYLQCKFAWMNWWAYCATCKFYSFFKVFVILFFNQYLISRFFDVFVSAKKRKIVGLDGFLWYYFRLFVTADEQFFLF